MAHPLRSSVLGLLSGAGIVIAGCSEPSGFLDRVGSPEPIELVADPPPQMAAVQDSITPARLAGFIGYYAPSSNTPDHELSWIRTETGPLRQIQSTIRRHGAWVRRDWTDRDLANSEFIHLPTGIMVSEARDAAGQLIFHSIRAPRPDARNSVAFSGLPRGVRQERLGEPCEEHDVYSRAQFRHVACVTADGISVSEHTEGANGDIWSTSPASAARLTRRAIPAALVQPPRFARDAWIEDPTSVASKDGGDYSVLLEPQQGGSQFLMRRRQGWIGEERRNRDGSATISARNPAGGRWVVARLGPDARPEEVTYRSRAIVGPGEGDAERLDQPGETILGQFCSWYNVMPGVEDGGRLECQTSDGMPLRIQTIVRGSISTDAVATRFDRRQFATADLLPPQAWTSPQHWGVPAPHR